MQSVARSQMLCYSDICVRNDALKPTSHYTGEHTHDIPEAVTTKFCVNRHLYSAFTESNSPQVLRHGTC